MSDLIHVAVGVITNSVGEILLAQRPAHLHQGGLWEFPGGKVEAGESVQQALRRELEEEVAITLQQAEPLIRIPYHYPEHSVLLDVWEVERFVGEPRGVEGQPLRWVAPGRLPDYAFPAANRPIVAAARLPDRYMITGEFQSVEEWLAKLEQALRQGIRLVQLRLKQLPTETVISLTNQAVSLCHESACQVLLNADPSRFEHLEVDGFHLPASDLSRYSSRPIAPDKWLSASIHNPFELDLARQLDVDMGLVAPVQPTITHPDAGPLGWSRFRELTEQAGFPIYALGGMQLEDIARARQQGGQGVAGIRLFWR